MQPDSFQSESSGVSHPPVSKLERRSFWLFVAAVALTPLVFWPSPFIALDLAKTVLITLGTLVTAVVYILVARKEGKYVLPPRLLTWTSIAVVVSILLSAVLSDQIGKSLFGQGFEYTVSTFLVLFVAGLVAFTLSFRRSERGIIVYGAIIITFLILWVFHAVRLVFGADILSFSIFNTLTTSVIGNWYSFATYSLAITMIALLALIILPLSRRMKVFSWALVALSGIAAALVNNPSAWFSVALVFLGLTFLLSTRTSETGQRRLISGIAWIPFIAFVVAALFCWKGPLIVNPLTNALRINYPGELSLPWQLTLDVTSSVIKGDPLTGVGPNLFSQAYITHKPLEVNLTPAWNVEFNWGFGLFPTLVSTQGLIGLVTWILFLVCIGIYGGRILKRLPRESSPRFILLSSYAVSVFILIVALFTVPALPVLLLAAVSTGIWVGTASALGILTPLRIGVDSQRVAASARIASLVIIVAIGLWAVAYLQRMVAFAYFGSGVKHLTVEGNADASLRAFGRALLFDTSDIYWRARTEALLSKATQLAGTVPAATSTAAKEAISAQVIETLKTARAAAESAVEQDPKNYYNHISMARVGEVGTNVGVPDSYQMTVDSYAQAIRTNPRNPLLYLNLARFQAAQNHLDEAIQAVGAAIQVKNNYLDAIFLLSQIQAAKGNMADAIVAARVATEIEPSNPLIFFQLGLLYYNNKQFTEAIAALEKAIALEPTYANAHYFLGLSFAETRQAGKAIAEFESLATTNPESQEVALILANLRAGRAPFANARPPVNPDPDDRTSLPLEEDEE